jgi:hypothetical protein
VKQKPAVEGSALGLHRSLPKCDLPVLRQPDILVFDAQGMENDTRDAASFEFQDKQEGKIVALGRIDCIVVDEVARRGEDGLALGGFDALRCNALTGFPTLFGLWRSVVKTRRGALSSSLRIRRR